LSTVEQQTVAVVSGGVSPAASVAPAEPLTIVPRAPQVVVLERVADLEAYREAWTTLADQALEPNVFYDPGMLLPSLRAFARAADLAVVLVVAEPPASARKAQPPELLGLFPLERRPAGTRWPVSHLRFWTGDFSYLPIPLLHPVRAAEALRAFFDWLERQRRAPALLEVERLPLGGPVHGLLVDEINRRGLHRLVLESHTRSLFEPSTPIEAYLERVLPGKDRREIERQRKRLQEAGKAEIVPLGAQEDPAAWVEEFLALESRGWKGRQGTALASRESDARYFREMFADTLARGRLSSTALRLEGRVLAMQILLHSGAGAFGFKTCYDEEHARHAPGVHLEIDLMEKVAANAAAGRAPRWIDSAAVSDHPLFNRIYGEKRTIEDWLLTPDSTLGLFLSLAPLYRWARRTLGPLMKKKIVPVT
jgi:CelD/BcsL family acetyltransferase involved in cellulose biosynthesis